MCLYILFSEPLNFPFFQNFDLIFAFSDQKVHQIYYALIILLFIMYIIFIFKGCFDFDTLFSFFPLSPKHVLLLPFLCYYHIISVYMYILKSQFIFYNNHNHVLISYSNENFWQIIYCYFLSAKIGPLHVSCQRMGTVGYSSSLLTVQSRCADGCMHYFGRGEISIAKVKYCRFWSQDEDWFRTWLSFDGGLLGFK